MTAEQIQALAAVMTFFAATLAVWATFRAPRLAAEFAENLRAGSQREAELRHQKLVILSNLMQYRSQMLHPNAIGALNLIEVVFVDSPEVRVASRHFHEETTKQNEAFSADRLRERYLGIIEKIARDMGLSDRITLTDIQNSYYPKGLGEADEAAFLETRDKLQRLRYPSQDVAG
jgi:hypothetical protein